MGVTKMMEDLPAEDLEARPERAARPVEAAVPQRASRR
jgi:hypothetical protein